MITGDILRRKHNLAKTKIEDLRGALQAVLLSLEVAVDLLTPPGALVEEAQGHLNDALVVLREELGE